MIPIFSHHIPIWQKLRVHLQGTQGTASARWGHLHKASFKHPLTKALGSLVAAPRIMVEFSSFDPSFVQLKMGKSPQT